MEIYRTGGNIPVHPEITTAAVTGPEVVDGKLRYTFSRAIGVKG